MTKKEEIFNKYLKGRTGDIFGLQTSYPEKFTLNIPREEEKYVVFAEIFPEYTFERMDSDEWIMFSLTKPYKDLKIAVQESLFAAQKSSIDLNFIVLNKDYFIENTKQVISFITELLNNYGKKVTEWCYIKYGDDTPVAIVFEDKND